MPRYGPTSAQRAADPSVRQRVIGLGPQHEVAVCAQPIFGTPDSGGVEVGSLVSPIGTVHRVERCPYYDSR